MMEANMIETIEEIEERTEIDEQINERINDSLVSINKSLAPHREIGSTHVKRSRKPMIIALAFLLLAAGAVVGYRYYAFSATHESTDDAFIEGHVIPISPKVSGHVLKIYVDDNQQVKKGDLLLEIDARHYQTRLAQSR